MTSFFIDEIPSGAEYYPPGMFFRYFVPDRDGEFLAHLQFLDKRVTWKDLGDWTINVPPSHLSESFAIKDTQLSGKGGEALCSLCIFRMEVDELHTGKEFQVYVDGLKFWIKVFRNARKEQKLRVYVGDSAWDDLHRQGVLEAREVDFVRMKMSSSYTEVGVLWRCLAFDDYDYAYVYLEETDGHGSWVDGKWKIGEAQRYDREVLWTQLRTPLEAKLADMYCHVLLPVPVEEGNDFYPVDDDMPLMFWANDVRLSEPLFLYRLSEYMQTFSVPFVRGPRRLPFSFERMLIAHFERGTSQIVYHPLLNGWTHLRERHPNLNFRYIDDQWLFHLTKVMKVNIGLPGADLMASDKSFQRFGESWFVKRLYDHLER